MVSNAGVFFAKDRERVILKFKEIEAKKEVRNNAAHGHFDGYTKADVAAFHEFVQRFLVNLVR